MGVRFKFRSSAGFDAVDLGGAASISIRDLRARIVEQSNLKICRDFDLVVSDAETGEEYKEEGFMIPEGSSVVIKRVPAVLEVPGGSGNFATRDLSTLVSSPSENVDLNNFDDFGNDLYPGLDTSLPNSDADIGDTNHCTDREENIFPRCSKKIVSGYQNIETSDLSEAMPKGNLDGKCDVPCNGYRNKKEQRSTHQAKELRKFNGNDDDTSPIMMNPDIPMELKCSLCNTIFKEAVMIPCCQHSFCDKCIRVALEKNSRCPKCDSTKCGVTDLLPNLSLRQAIERFPDSHIHNSGSEKIIPEYAPDGESGIHGKTFSCAASIHQQGENVQGSRLPDSPSATGKGSNQVMTESAYDSLIKNKVAVSGTGSRIIRLNADKSMKSSPLTMKQKEVTQEHCIPKNTNHMLSELPRNLLQKDEVTLVNKKKKGLFANPTDVSGSLPGNMISSVRHRKGERNCYMCGSPDHLVRDCPAAANPYPMLQSGDAMFPGGMPTYGQTYWHGNSFLPVQPYASFYGASGMMPFDPTMVPVTHFTVPSYMPPIYSGLPVPCGYMRMGGVAPPRASGMECPPTRSEVMELQECERKLRAQKNRLERERSVGDYDLMEEYHYSDSWRRSHDRKTERDDNSSSNYSRYESPRLHRKRSLPTSSYSPSRYRSDVPSDDEIISVDHKHEKGTRMPKSRRDKKTDLSEKSSSDLQYASDTSKRQGREKKKHRHESGGSKNHAERAQHDSDSSRKSHHKLRRESSLEREKALHDHKRHSSKHHRHNDSARDPESSCHKRHLEKELDHRSRNLRDKDFSTDEQMVSDRWEMLDAFHDSDNGEYHYFKRKKTH